MSYEYERRLFGYLENLRVYVSNRPLVLGGVSSPGGGAGGPPGGFVGKLPQNQITYDPSELGLTTTSGTGSLWDNLNHIRYRISDLESGGSGVIGGGHLITYNGASQNSRGKLDFSGEGVTVLDDPGNDRTAVVINASGTVTISGASGSFRSVDYKTITVLNGIIMTIEDTTMVQVVARTGDSTTQKGDWSSTGGTWSHTVGSGNDKLLIVGTKTNNNYPHIASITYNGADLNLTASAASSASDQNPRVEIWTLLNPPVGTYNIVLTMSAASTWSAGVLVLEHVKQSAPFGDPSANSYGTDTRPTVSVTAMVDDLVFGIAGYISSDTTELIESPAVEIWNCFSEWNHRNLAGGLDATTGTNSIAWNLNNTCIWAACALPIRSVSN